jgi:hypothetical protein
VPLNRREALLSLSALLGHAQTILKSSTTPTCRALGAGHRAPLPSFRRWVPFMVVPEALPLLAAAPTAVAMPVRQPKRGRRASHRRASRSGTRGRRETVRLPDRIKYRAVRRLGELSGGVEEGARCRWPQSAGSFRQWEQRNQSRNPRRHSREHECRASDHRSLAIGSTQIALRAHSAIVVRVIPRATSPQVRRSMASNRRK